MTLTKLAEVGVRRVSVGGGLAWAAYGVLIDGAREMKESGTFNWMKSINTDNTIDNLLKPS
jgi:2-methylisocitrate lyase-like PEP mutase family enzyme